MKKPIVLGVARGGPCEGKEFQHTADMERVRISDGEKPKAALHLYAYDAARSQEEGRRVYGYRRN